MRLLYYFILIPLSLLPYFILYKISDFLYVIIYKFLRYRRNTVYTNIKNSFPEMNLTQINSLETRFYKHLCDLIVESIKGFTISEKQIKDRLKVINPGLVNNFADNNQSVILVGGHYNNWEIAAQAFSLYHKHDCIGIYKPIKNKFFNKKLSKSRTTFGLNLVSMIGVKKILNDATRIKAVIFGSDQSPSNAKKSYWLNFLNQETAVLFGAEKYAKEFNMPVIYVAINKIRRGYYEITYKIITSQPKLTSHGSITESFTKELETQIINQPEYWLWSHKRWKHKKIK